MCPVRVYEAKKTLRSAMTAACLLATVFKSRWGNDGVPRSSWMRTKQHSNMKYRLQGMIKYELIIKNILHFSKVLISAPQNQFKYCKSKQAGSHEVIQQPKVTKTSHNTQAGFLSASCFHLIKKAENTSTCCLHLCSRGGSSR